MKMRTALVWGAVFLLGLSGCGKKKSTKTAPKAGPAPAAEARKAGPPPPNSVPFFRNFRMGMGPEEVKKVAAAYAKKGVLGAAVVGAGKKGEAAEASGASGTPGASGKAAPRADEKKADASPNEIVVPIKAVPWKGKKVAVGQSMGRKSRIEFRFEKGKLTKLEIDAFGFIPASFTAEDARKYLTTFHPTGRYVRMQQADPGEISFRIKDRAFEIEFIYRSAVGHLEIELDYKPGR